MRDSPIKALYPHQKKPFVDEKTLQVQFFEESLSDVKPLDRIPADFLEFEFLSLIEIGRKLEGFFVSLMDLNKK